MIKVDRAHVIRHKVLVEGLSARRVADELQVSRNTVRKYLAEPEPTWKGNGRQCPALEKVGHRLGEVLAEWETKTTRKQRVTAAGLHRQLVAEGHHVSVRTISRFMRERRRKALEVAIPLVHAAGDEAQVDFFQVTVDVEGERRQAWMFLMHLMFSGKDYARLYWRQDQIAFLDGHVRAFRSFGGVPRRCVYDNLKAAVLKHLAGSERLLTKRFKALANHYSVEPCFARPRRGDDKGGVESRGKGIRLRHLTPIPAGRTLDEISDALLEGLAKEDGSRLKEGRTVRDRFEEEHRMLRGLPDVRFDPRRVLTKQANRSAQVRFDGVVYSVPSRWKSLPVMAYVGVNEVEFVCRGERVARPRRPRGSKEIRYRDYLPELSRRPQAVRQVAPLLMVELGAPYRELWQLLIDVHGEKRASRTMAAILGAVVEHGESKVSAAVRRALRCERVELLGLAPIIQGEARRQAEVPERLTQYAVETVSPSCFDSLLTVGEVR